MISILCNSSNEYAIHCKVMLTSLFENNKQNDKEVYVLSTFMSDENIRGLEFLGQRYDTKVQIIVVDSQKLKFLPVHFSYHNVACYLRLLAADLLPDINKLLYLDCDIIVNSDLKALWDMDIEDYAFAATHDLIYCEPNFKKNLQLKENDTYVNTGVMLINCDYWRKNYVAQKALDYAIHNGDKMIAADQDALNATMQGTFKVFSEEWNVYPDYFYEKPNLYNNVYPILNEIRKNPKIIHFLYVKPWINHCNHPFRYLYEMYYEMAEGKPFVMKRNKESIKRDIVRLKHYLLDLIGIRHYYHVYDNRFNNSFRRFC